jgi:hypothetical protein
MVQGDAKLMTTVSKSVAAFVPRVAVESNSTAESPKAQ